MEEYKKHLKYIIKQNGECYDVFKIKSTTTILSLGWFENDGITPTKKGIENLNKLKKNTKYKQKRGSIGP